MPCLEGRRASSSSGARRKVFLLRAGFGTPLEEGPAACLGAGGSLQFKMKEAELLVEVT